MDSTNTNTVRVSVLTPVYKHDIRYTRKCLESLKAQTLKDCEFIIIDNGAVKEVKELVDNVTRDDERFRIIKLSKNRGYGRAMNAGLAAARGEYIGVVESDDFVEPTMFEVLYTIGEKYNVDIVKSLFYIYENERDARVGISFKPGDYDSPKKNVEVPEYCFKMGSFWSAIYRREMIEKHEIRFEEQSQPSGEDVMWTLKTYFFCRNIFITPKILYHYRKDNPNSSIRKKDSKVRNCMNLYSKLISYLEHRKSEMKDIYWNMLCRRHFLNFILAVRAGEVSRRNWWLLRKVSTQFKYNLRKGYVKLDPIEDREYRQVAYHPFRTFISGSIYPTKPCKERDIANGYSCIRLFSLILIYSQFRQQNYTKEKYFGCLYKKVYSKPIMKHYFLGMRIARIAENDSWILGVRSRYFSEKHEISFLGIPLLSTVYHGEMEGTKRRNRKEVTIEGKQVDYLVNSIKEQVENIRKETRNGVTVEKKQVDYLTNTIKEQVEGLRKETRNGVTVEKKQVDYLTNTIKEQVEGLRKETRNGVTIEKKQVDYLTNTIKEQALGVQGRVNYGIRVVHSVTASLHAARIHPNVFARFRNLYEGKEIAICGCGSTFGYYSPIEGAVHVGINRAFRRRDIRFDFLFAQDAFDEGMEEINKYRPKSCVKFYGWLPNERAKQVRHVVRRIQPRDYSEGRAHKYILEDIVQGHWAVDLTLEPLGDFQGTVFSALQFACFTKPKRIFLVGCDCSSNHFYEDDEECDLTYQHAAWTKFAEFANDIYPEIEIISVNPIGLRGMFHDLYTQAFLREQSQMNEEAKQ